MTASEEGRAKRVATREDGDWQEVLEGNRLRHGSDARRYRMIYGYDLADTSVYDLVLSTDDETPESLVEQLLVKVGERFAAVESSQ
jgi:cytidylate kinase